MPQDHKTTPEFQQIRQTAPERKMSYPILFIFFCPGNVGTAVKSSPFGGEPSWYQTPPVCHSATTARSHVSELPQLLCCYSRVPTRNVIVGCSGG